MLSLEQGAALVSLARKAIESHFSLLKLRTDNKTKQLFSETQGCFVTLHSQGQLRGCIGFAQPATPLYETTISAARAAAFNDPRFPPIEKSNVDSVTVEISVLTKPKRIDVRNPEDYLNKITIGKDGLLIVGTFQSGLLLPQVATENHWDNRTFLEQACLKASLSPDDWLDFNKTRVYVFQSQVFAESSPKGEIIQIM